MLSCKAYVHGGCVEGEGRCVGRRQNVGAAAGAVAGAFHTRQQQQPIQQQELT